MKASKRSFLASMRADVSGQQINGILEKHSKLILIMMISNQFINKTHDLPPLCSEQLHILLHNSQQKLNHRFNHTGTLFSKLFIT